MNRILTSVAVVLALCAPVAAHACDISSNPVSQDEVQAAGLGPIVIEAAKEMYDTTQLAATKWNQISSNAKIEAAQYLFKWRMAVIATTVRCGVDAGWKAFN
jgi:hypothetical protein